MGQTIIEKIKKYWRKKKSSTRAIPSKGGQNETKGQNSKAD